MIWKFVAISELFIAIPLIYLLFTPALENRNVVLHEAMVLEHSATSIKNEAVKKVRRILVDLGANCGNSYELFKHDVEEFYLVEPQTAVFTKWLVPRSSEAVHVFNAAISDHDEENIPFFVDSPYASDVCTFDKGYPHGASSLDSVSATVNGVAPIQQTVRLLDIASFLRETVHARMEDYLILKIDIEGSEEPVLRRLISENILYLPDKLFVEWHPSTLAFQKEFESSIFRYEQWIL